MWQTVCFVISAKDIKCLFWYKLGGVRLAGRTGEQEEDVKGREMSIYEECLSEQVVYTWQTLIIIIIIIIIICKGHSELSGYLSAAMEPCFSLDSSISVKYLHFLQENASDCCICRSICPGRHCSPAQPPKESPREVFVIHIWRYHAIIE